MIPHPGTHSAPEEPPGSGASAAILFDLDGTLLDREASIRKFVADQHDRLPILHSIPKPQYVARFIELDAHGHVWKDQVYQTLATEFRIPCSELQNLLKDYETEFARSCTPFAGLRSTLTLLKDAGYRLGIITNGFEVFQHRVIRALDIEHFFTAILVSESEGVRKPEEEIFHRAARRLDVSPARSVFVGDNPQVDVAGAKNAGMKAIWKRNPVWSPPKNPDAIIDGLDELPSTIQRILENVLSG